MERIIEIDLGTTNSCVAIVDGDTVVLTNQGGYKTLWWLRYQRTVSDLSGISQSGGGDQRCEYGICLKRLIGRRWGTPPVRRMVETMPYTIVEGQTRCSNFQLPGDAYIPFLRSASFSGTSDYRRGLRVTPLRRR